MQTPLNEYKGWYASPAIPSTAGNMEMGECPSVPKEADDAALVQDSGPSRAAICFSGMSGERVTTFLVFFMMSVIAVGVSVAVVYYGFDVAMWQAVLIVVAEVALMTTVFYRWIYLNRC
jgi:hypothetical protein